MDIAALGFRSDSSQVRRSTKDLRDQTRAAEGAERAAVSMGGAFGSAAAKLAAFVVAGAGIRQATATIANFEDGMAKVAAVSGATSAELASMRDIAKELGSTTEFSATQAAGGLEFLAMAGFSASEAVAALPGVLDLATASGLGLARVADIASNVMSGFGIAATEVAEVSDVLAKASSIANTNVAQLGQAMSYAAPVANTLEVSVAETAAAIGVLSDAGVQGGRAGNALRTMMTKLMAPTEAAGGVLEELGLGLADIDVQANGLGPVLETLAAKNVSLAQATELVGLEVASNLLLLTKNAEKYDEYADTLANAEGTTGDMAATMRDTLGGSLKGLGSSIEGLILALGDAGLTAAIRTVIDGGDLSGAGRHSIGRDVLVDRKRCRQRG